MNALNMTRIVKRINIVSHSTEKKNSRMMIIILTVFETKIYLICLEAYIQFLPFVINLRKKSRTEKMKYFSIEFDNGILRISFNFEILNFCFEKKIRNKPN